jgi:membrane protein implicated in regulation of membrane protease activity
MTVLFLVPLAIALVSVYIYENSAEEMSYLTAITAIVSLFVTLAIAPWQVQILLLLGALLSSQWLLAQYQRRNQAQEQALETPAKAAEPPATAAKLIYRGQTYDHSSDAVEASAESASTAKLTYRGQTYDHSSDKAATTATDVKISHPPKLTYRGQTYDRSPAKVTEVAGKLNITYSPVAANPEPGAEVKATENNEAPKKFRFNYRGANLAKKS